MKYNNEYTDQKKNYNNEYENKKNNVMVKLSPSISRTQRYKFFLNCNKNEYSSLLVRLKDIFDD